MTTKKERINIIKMLEKLNEHNLIYLYTNNTYESVVYGEERRKWSSNFSYYFTIMDSPSSNEIYIATDITEYLGRLIVESGLDYSPLDDLTWWEEHRFDIIDDNLALPELHACGEECLSEYERVKNIYIQKSSWELKKTPKGLRKIITQWIHSFFTHLKVLALRAEYVTKKTGIEICIGSLEEISTWASRYHFYVTTNPNNKKDIQEKFKTAIYAADPYNHYIEGTKEWYLNKPKYRDPFWNLNEFTKTIQKPHFDYEYWETAIQKALEKIKKENNQTI